MEVNNQHLARKRTSAVCKAILAPHTLLNMSQRKRKA
jgi:hypothetical protein